MKFFKVTLSSFDDEKTEFFILPKEDEKDENGNPVFNEKAVQSLQQFKDFVKRTSTPVVDVHYFLCEISEEIPAIDFQLFKTLEEDEKLTVLDQNDFPVTTKKVKSKSGKINPMYIVGGCAVALVVVMMIFAGMKKSGGNMTTKDLFTLEESNNMAVAIYFDKELPEVYFTAPDGTVYNNENLKFESGEDWIQYYIPNASIGAWKVSYDQKTNTVFEINYSSYTESIYISSFNFGDIRNSQIPITFLVSGEDVSDYQWEIYAVITDGDSTTGERLLSNGSAAFGDEVSRDVDISGLADFAGYKLRLDVWQKNGVEEAYDSKITDKTFAVSGGTTLKAIDDFHTELNLTDGKLIVDWGEWSLYSEYIIAVFDDSKSTAEPFYYTEITDGRTRAEVLFDTAAPSIRIDITGRKNGENSETKSKTISIDTGAEIPAETTVQTEYEDEPSQYYDGNGIYNLSFSANGGKGQPATQQVYEGDYASLPTSGVLRDGYTLAGWSQSPDIQYPLYNFTMPAADTVLYAVWEPNSYTVTYDSSGGLGLVSAAKVKYGESVSLPTKGLKKSGYELVGWSTAPQSQNKITSMTMPAYDITLYAVWEEEKTEFTVTLSADGEEKAVKVKAGERLDLLDDFGFEKDGYIVSGWRFDYSSDKNTISNLKVTENITLIAVWSKAKYITVTIDRSYLGKAALKEKVAVNLRGEAMYTPPQINNRNDPYNYAPGCTYGWTTKKTTGEFGNIEYFGGEEYALTKDVTLYRVLAEYGGGKGTKDEPYLITYYDQLERLAQKGAKGYFKQTADINMPDDYTHKSINTARITSGTANYSYDWFVYDGQNFEINNLKGSALFGKIAAATIMNVTVRNAQITTTGNSGVIANESISYYIANDNGNGYIATGDSKLEGCSVIGAKITAASGNVGGIIGVGGKLEGCYAQDIKITGKSQAAGGISGLPDTIKACAAKGITIEGAVNAGGIAGSLEGISVYELGNFNGTIGGSIVGSAARNIVISKSETAGGIAGLTTSNSSSAKIRSCYAANLMLNGTKSSGSISGGDYGLAYSHTIAYCIVDDTNSYDYIGGDKQRSTLNTVILKVPYSGFTVDGVLSVLNNTGSGYTGWERSDGVFDGYAYPKEVKEVVNI